MKKLISFILVIAILCSTGIMSFAVTGEGSVLNPYLIETAEDVLAISDDLSAHYMLAADIDMSAVTDFYPIGNSRSGAFTGTFDGNGKKISNLSINTPREKYTGFIGYNEGTIKNLTLENVYVEGDRYTGGITGFNSTESSVTNCSVSGNVNVEEASTVSLTIGGAIGYNAGIAENINCEVDVKLLPLDSSYGIIYLGGGVGCNTGTVTNLDFWGDVELFVDESIYIESVLYAGGGVAHNTGDISYIYANETINITINKTTYHGDIYVGGVTAYNSGTAKNVCSSGKINVNTNKFHFDKKVYLAGVIAYNYGIAEMMSSNTSIYGDGLYSINSSADTYVYAGGLIGYNYYDLLVKGALNTKPISISGYGEYSYSYVGGLIGFSYNTLNIKNSSNTAEITINGRGTVGGLVGYGNNTLNIENSSNSAKIAANNSGYSGGLAGISSKTFISGCINTGDITCKGLSSFAGGIVANTNSSTCRIEKCYNSGNITADGNGSNGSAVAAGISTGWYPANKGHFLNTTYSINVGKVTSPNTYYSSDEYTYALGISRGYVSFSFNGEMVFSRDSSEFEHGTTGNYNISFKHYNEYTYKNIIQKLMNADTENTWITDPNVNNGYPYPPYIPNMPLMNKTVKDMKAGDEFTLTVFQNGEPVSDVTWSLSDTSVVKLMHDGCVKALKKGTVTITATLPDGMKAVCSVNVYDSPEINTETTDLTINKNVTADIKAISDTSDEYVGEVVSSNPEICSVALANDSKTDTIKITGVAEGTATITVTTVLGTVKTFIATVTNNANAISVPSSYKLNRGDSYKLNVTLDPPDAVSKLTWVSSNEDIVSVDENGVLTGNNTGTASITIQTDNGYVALCDVTVVAPVKSFSFESNPLVLIKGTTGYVNAIPNPIDTTDTITYSSSNTSYATVNSSTGLVTAIKTGSAIITAKSSSGVIGQCAVVIEDEKIPVESITLNRNSLYLKGGESQLLSVALAPENATNKRVKWSVADPSIASVSDNGVVTGLASGTTVVTVSDYDETVFAECNVTVIIDVTGVSFENSEIQINESESQQLTAIIEPVGATNQNVSWSSSDESVVTVDENGVITAISKGSATITVTTEDWAKTATCNVTVIKPITEIVISHESVTMGLDDTLSLSYSFAPSDATVPSVTWKSSNPFVASVDKNGCVTALKAGNAVITVTDENGISASCKVKVTTKYPSIEIYNFSHSYEQKLDLFDRYSDAKMKLGYYSYNCEDAVRFEWSSSNRRVKIDKDGNITNTGFFGRSSTITIKAIDAQGKVIARKSVKVMFYKLLWQRDRLQSQSIVSDNYLNRNLSAQALEASFENETVAFFSCIIEFIKRTFSLLKI